MESPTPERRIPKWLARGIGVLAIVVVVAFVMIAFRSSKEKGTESAAEASPDVTQLASESSSGDFLSCTDCHGNLDKALTDGSAADRLLNYTHKMHFAKGISDCANCHPLPAHEPDKTNKPTMGRCFMCHGTAKSSIAPGTCETCHPANSPAVPSSHRQGNWLKDHPESALADPFECATCHSQSFCENCHGLPMPHPDNWSDDPHVESFFDVGQQVCTNCHQVTFDAQQAMKSKGRDFCDQCHHDFGGPKDKPWIKYHPEVVKAGDAQQCFTCHNPSTCATCHVSGTENLSADRANFIAEQGTEAGQAVPGPASGNPGAESPSASGSGP